MNARRPHSLAALAVVAALLAGCGNVRLETPAPTVPEPDAIELVRRSALDDALAMGVGAGTLAASAGFTAQQQSELQRIEALANVQADALGGVYESGLDGYVVSPTETLVLDERPAIVGATSPDILVGQLSTAGERNRATADAAEDGPTARLFASIAVAQAVAHARLASALGLASPDGLSLDLPVAGLDSEAVLPVGPSAEYLRALVLAEDSARYAFEVAAARADDVDAREFYRSRARLHRDRAEGWARVGSFSATADDPRQLAYDLPPQLDTDEFLLSLEEKLGEIYATLIGQAEPGSRGLLIDLLAESALFRNSRGAAPQQFPGLPGFMN